MTTTRVDDFEGVKENFQPKRDGYSAAVLKERAEASHAAPAAADPEYQGRVAAFEQAVCAPPSASEEDPLGVWLDYIEWLQDVAATKRAPDNRLASVLKRCVDTFRDAEMYRADRRFARVCRNYADTLEQPQDAYDIMLASGIGTMNAQFLAAAAAAYEAALRWDQAECVLDTGVHALASDPVAQNTVCHALRMTRVRREMWQQQHADDVAAQTEQQQGNSRLALGKLSKKEAASSVRPMARGGSAGAAASRLPRPKGGLAKALSAAPAEGNTVIPVFANIDASSSRGGGIGGGDTRVARAAALPASGPAQENTLAPGRWNDPEAPAVTRKPASATMRKPLPDAWGVRDSARDAEKVELFVDPALAASTAQPSAATTSAQAKPATARGLRQIDAAALAARTAPQRATVSSASRSGYARALLVQRGEEMSFEELRAQAMAARAPPVGPAAQTAPSQPVQRTPVRSQPVQHTPVRSQPVQRTPVRSQPVQRTPVQSRQTPAAHPAAGMQPPIGLATPRVRGVTPARPRREPLPAPSPTVNTKAALADIYEMFAAPLPSESAACDDDDDDDFFTL